MTSEESKEYLHKLEIDKIRSEIEDVRHSMKVGWFVMVFCFIILYVVTHLNNKSIYPESFWDSYNQSHPDSQYEFR